jgi:hypothetical protein
MEEETKETFASIISKVEEALKPLGCEIYSVFKRHMVGPFSWNESKIPTDDSQQELTLTVVYVKETSRLKDAPKISLLSEIEKVMVSFGFDIADLNRGYKPANKLPGGHQHDEITLFTLTFVRMGELG